MTVCYVSHVNRMASLLARDYDKTDQDILQLVLLANGHILWFQIIFGSLNIASTHMISGCMAVHVLAWVFNTVGNDVIIHNSMI